MRSKSGQAQFSCHGRVVWCQQYSGKTQARHLARWFVQMSCRVYIYLSGLQQRRVAVAWQSSSHLTSSSRRHLNQAVLASSHYHAVRHNESWKDLARALSLIDSDVVLMPCRNFNKTRQDSDTTSAVGLKYLRNSIT